MTGVYKWCVTNTLGASLFLISSSFEFRESLILKLEADTPKFASVTGMEGTFFRGCPIKGDCPILIRITSPLKY